MNIITPIIDWIDSILFFFLFLEVAYLLLLGSVMKSTVFKCRIDKYFRYAVLIPKGYPFPEQDYKHEYFQFFYYDNWRTEMKKIEADDFDMAIILGPFESIPKDLLSILNIANNSGFKALQLHTILNNKHTYKVRRKARLEELRNGLLKSGRCGIGLSSALDKYNFAIPLKWAQKYLKSEKTNLEWALTSHHIFIKYLIEPMIIAEGFPEHFKQRPFKKSIKRLLQSIQTRNLEEIERSLHRIFPSYKFLILILLAFSLSFSFYSFYCSIKWWMLLYASFFAFSLAMPDYVMESHKQRKSINLNKLWKSRQSK